MSTLKITRPQIRRVVTEAMGWSSHQAEMPLDPYAQQREDEETEAKWAAKRALEAVSSSLPTALRNLQKAQGAVRLALQDEHLATDAGVAAAMRELTRAIRALENASVRGGRG